MVRSSATAWSCSLALALSLTLALVALVVATSASTSDYPGVIELVGYSNRRARAYFQEEDPKPQAKPNPPSAKTRADIETVKRNIRKYDRLLELDTKNLPEQQKDMLARIVERVARLKESLDIEEQQFSQQQEATSSRTSTSSSSSTSTTQRQQTEAETETEQELAQEQSTLPPTGSTETETDPTLLLDETTLLELQHTMNEQAALQAAVTQQTTLMKDLPTTTDFSQEAGAGTSDHNEEEETGETTSANLTTQPEISQETEEQSQEEEEQAAASTTSDEALTGATDPDDQFVAARSNNNIAAITAADADPSSSSTTTTATSAGSQQRTLTTMGKLKHRQATKRPFGHKVTTALKRGAQRPSSNSAAAANAAAASKPPSGSTTQKQKLSTNASYQQKQQTKPLQKVTPSLGTSSSASMPSSSSALPSATTNSANSGLPIEQLYTRTPQANIPPLAAAAAAAAASSSAAAAAGAPGAAATTYSSQQDSLVYDGHVNASALIDSLSTNAREEYYQQKLGSAANNKDNKKTATAKPTKYHYYPHNQHIYLLPECAIQQVCNAVYVRLNYTQPLCACPSRYRDPCSASLNEDDQHTTKLVGDNKKKAITLAKTCEATTEMRECRSPKDWSLLALQNTRTGKSHYLVICRCPDHFKMEGPMAHDQPTYASVPGIRVFGMMCVKPGYSVRKPSSQPPKRYQLQKPFYRPSVGGSSSSIGGQKDSYGRPIYGGSSSSSSSSSNLGGSPISSNYQPQDQQSFQNGGPSSSYQYLNRPESTHSSHSSSSANFRPDQFSINNFPGSNYGRNNERRGDKTSIEAIDLDTITTGIEEYESSTPANEEARTTLQAQQQQESEPAAASPVTTLPEPALEGSTRIRRSLAETMDHELEPEFPWDRVVEFQQSIVWD
ncbi:ras guanine nucleotide exchange factor glfB isoform X1 [Drosophila obscura]|uniref:ras guanine nucleotide exchange factor glfB isoform X1 n=1 Tax=Drosophila obscura TaxID=7282 RepID=UPI001BB27143|nr:ras guanine nucleotide exchange factor glfB isoform X1 [Drosophila obscura]